MACNGARSICVHLCSSALIFADDTSDRTAAPGCILMVATEPTEKNNLALPAGFLCHSRRTMWLCYENSACTRGAMPFRALFQPSWCPGGGGGDCGEIRGLSASMTAPANRHCQSQLPGLRRSADKGADSMP